MATAYHHQLENALIKMGDEWKSQRKLKQVWRGCDRPLNITVHRSRHMVKYKPDVYYILRNNKMLIFEILDTELKRQDAIIADTICSYLAENVDGLIFLHYGDEHDENRITESFTTVYGGLIDKGVKRSELPKPEQHEANSHDPLFCALSDMAAECYDKNDCENIKRPCRRVCNWWWSRLTNRSSDHHIRQGEYEKFKAEFERFRPK